MLFLFFFNVPATPAIYTLSLHDALPISSTFTSAELSRAITSRGVAAGARMPVTVLASKPGTPDSASVGTSRSEEHTSELQSQSNLVCRLLLEKKNTIPTAYDVYPLDGHH